MFASVIRVALVGAALCGCGFDHGRTPGDAPNDVPPDMSSNVPHSCDALHKATPSAPSGTYMIDPDGAGANPALQVVCDMTTDGGGWTIVFFPTSANVPATPTWTSATPRLLSDAVQVLVAYRDSSQLNIIGDRALFGLPDEWKIMAPFAYTTSDITMAVSINGANALPHMVRYGNQNFGQQCGDAWITTAGVYGRFCIAGTTAPFFTGFSVPTADTCSDSSQQWDAATCTSDKRFSIAVR